MERLVRRPAPGHRPRETSGKACVSARAAARARISLCGRRINVVGVKPDLVVNFAFLGIAEDVVGFGERFELLFGCLVPGVDVGMILARQLAERLADILRRGGFLHAENFVIVFLGVVAI